MPTYTSIEAHAAAARLGFREVVRQLNNHLGATLVAALAGVKDRGLPTKWARADGPEPSDARQTRVYKAHALFFALAQAESESVARAWMIGSNPLLGEDTPITALREDRFKELGQALNAFLASNAA
jgi:hypothetical protein